MFGEMGAGKSYWAQRWSFHTGFPMLDGDECLPQKMLDKAAKFEQFTREEVSSFVDSDLAVAILRKIKDAPGLVVAQALYRDEDRRSLHGILTELGYDVTWLWLKPGIVQNIKNLWKRRNPWQWLQYWLLNKPYFQAPSHQCKIYHANGEVTYQEAKPTLQQFDSY
jgi:gluconate kinase